MTAPKPLRDLGHNDCRYPLGGPKEPAKLFCGQPAREGSAYCEEHHRVCYERYVPAKRRTEAA